MIVLFCGCDIFKVGGEGGMSKTWITPSQRVVV